MGKLLFVVVVFGAIVISIIGWVSATGDEYM